MNRFEAAMDLVEVQHSFPKDVADFHAERFRWLARDLSLDGVPTVVVAGSCGKASTARFLGHIALAMGHGVVLGTKPPLQETAEGNLERYQVGEGAGFRWLAPDEFADRVDELRPLLAQVPGKPAPYELRTWILARTAQVLRPGLFVCEANIGLRDDPAGALPRTDCVLLTPIGTDHGSLLRAPEGWGAALGAAAGPVWHKAGGVPAGVPVVLGRQAPAVADAAGPRELEWDRDFGVSEVRCGLDGSTFVLRLGERAEPVRLGVPGAFQVENAAHAAAAAWLLHARGLLPGDLWSGVREGLAAAEIPGRMQVLARRPTVLLNVATSPEKVQGMLDALEPLLRGRLVICATFLDRLGDRLGPVVDLLLAHPRLRALVATQFLDDDVNRDFPAAHVARHGPVQLEPDLPAAVARARSLALSPDDLVLLLGNGMAAAVAAGAAEDRGSAVPNPS